MDWYLYALYIFGLIVIAGITVVSVHHRLARRRNLFVLRFMCAEMAVKVKKIMREMIGESMDMIPEKIMEARKTMERNDI